jgi:branched-chain amino acid transport system substrate-binding protein
MLKKALSVAIVAAFGVAATGAFAQETVVKIGHVGPMTGGIAHLGKDNENGAKLAIKDLNAQGLTIGGKKIKFELLSEDDGADPKQGTTVAQKLVDAKVNGVIGHLNSGTTIPASRIYNDAGIPQISPSATNPKYTQQGFKNAYRVVAHDGQLGGTLGQYAVKTFKAKNIAVIDDATAYGEGVANEFKKSAMASGAKITATEKTNDKATDFRAILTKIKATNPEVVFFGGMDAVAGPMLKQMKELGIDAKFMGGDGICAADLVKLAGDAIGEGKVVCAEAGGITDAEKPKMDAWKARLKAEMGADVQIYAPYVYDSIMVMVEAMKAANSTDPKVYGAKLRATNYKGVTGLISFDDKGDIKNGTLTLHTYKGGKQEKIGVVR